MAVHVDSNTVVSTVPWLQYTVVVVVVIRTVTL
jgi:hypothetical protein